MRILKFGGSSVASPERIKDVIQIVKQSEYFEQSNCSSQSDYSDIAIVVSAQGGVTDRLVKLCELIPIDITSCENIIQDLERRHLDSLKALLPIAQHPAAMAEVMSMCNELSDIVKGASLVGEVTARTKDLILSFGERLSAYVVSLAFKYSEYVDINGIKDITKDADTTYVDVIYTDARQMIKTDSTYGQAKVDFEMTNFLIKDYFDKNKGLKVITGFIASSTQSTTPATALGTTRNTAQDTTRNTAQDSTRNTAQDTTRNTTQGQTTTLGRSGSDYTASIFGAALDAEVVEIWTDVDGMMTADPRYVEDAQSIDQLSYNEAMELSHFGAKVLFPASLQPAMNKKIPVLVKNTMNPSHKGTLVCAESSKNGGPIKGITSLKNICLINVEGCGMVGVAGVSARMFGALSQNHISVILISQASSEHSICIALMQENAEKACQLLKETFAVELAGGQITSISYESSLAIIAVVGENMRHFPGVAARVFSPLGKNKINVIAISQGSSEINISIVIHEDDLKKALCSLHKSFFNKRMR